MTYKEYIEKFNIKTRVIDKPIINDYSEVEDERRIKIEYVKDKVFSEIGVCDVYLFGSMIKGYWNDESDYDLIFYKHIDRDKQNYLKRFDYGFRVDISFSGSEKRGLGIKV